MKATVILFKASGKFCTEEEWEVPAGAIAPYVMQFSPDFHRIDGGAVFVPGNGIWGYPHLIEPDNSVERALASMTGDAPRMLPCASGACFLRPAEQQYDDAGAGEPIRTADTSPCWECLLAGEDPIAWCDCQSDDAATWPHPCRLRAHPPERCPNHIRMIEIPGAAPTPRQWISRTWVDVRPGDLIRPPGSEDAGSYADVVAAIPELWRIDPKTGTSSWNPPQPLDFTVIHVTMKTGMARLNLRTFDANPAAPVDIFLDSAELAAIELIGWPNRIRMISNESKEN